MQILRKKTNVSRHQFGRLVTLASGTPVRNIQRLSSGWYYFEYNTGNSWKNCYSPINPEIVVRKEFTPTMHEIKIGDKVRFRLTCADPEEDEYVDRIGIFIGETTIEDFHNDEVVYKHYADFKYKIQLCDTGEIVPVNDGTVEKVK